MFTLHLGDSREVLKGMAEASVDSIVCDPPYELGFMGKGWDSTGVANDPVLWREALRVLKPGGHLLAFSGTRTYHRMVCAIEDAGFAVRDQIGWLYGSGFPKSHNGEWGGTALKPAWEPICMARKPLVGTVEANWLAYGTGALNIDGCRVAHSDELNVPQSDPANRAGVVGSEWQATGGAERNQAAQRESIERTMAMGRWPANVIHDGSDEVLQAFPDAPGQQGDLNETGRDRPSSGRFGDMAPPHAHTARGDSGSAARFFYCAKADREDRNEGMKNPGPRRKMNDTEGGKFKDVPPREGANNHPTVKPTDLMRYLCRLVTPKGGTVLDPFMGSGSTGKAAMLEGFAFIGIDLTPEYIDIARARIEFARKQGYQPDLLETA